MENGTATVEILEGNNVHQVYLSRRIKNCGSLFVINFISMVILILLALALIFGKVAPTKTGFYCKDPLLSHKYTRDTINSGVLHLIHFVVPPFLFYIVESLGGFKRRSLRDVSFVWNWHFDLIIGLLLTLVMTMACKTVISSPRPHFFDTCLPDANKNCTAGTFVTSYKCNNQNSSRALLVETVRSFPSGHASQSTLASIYCATYLNVRLRNKHLGKVLKPLIVMLFLSWGLIVSLSRIEERRHHWWDVLAGCLLGILGAFYTIKYLSLNFKSLPRIKNPESGTVFTY